MGRASSEKQEFWRFVVSEQAASGLSIRVFCQQEGISEPSFYQWRKKFGPMANSVMSESDPVRSRETVARGGSLPDFLPVKVVPSTPNGKSRPQNYRLDDRSDSVSPPSALQIVTPCGFTINVLQASTTELISKTLAAFEKLTRDSTSC